MEKIKLKVGKVYETEDGGEILIMSSDGLGNYCGLAMEKYNYKNGSYNMCGTIPYSRDGKVLNPEIHNKKFTIINED